MFLKSEPAREAIEAASHKSGNAAVCCERNCAAEPVRPAEGQCLAESGQAAILMVLALAIFLLASLGFAIDYTNMWFHRQQLQAATDAACMAGGADMLEISAGETMPAMNFTPGTNGSCGSGSSSAPASMCTYASFNGFNPVTNSDVSVSWTFPGSISGVTPAPPSVAQYPFLQVSIVQKVKAVFSSLITGRQKETVSASSTCGLVAVQTPVPFLALTPTDEGIHLGLLGSIHIYGGPIRGVVDNSASNDAVFFNLLSYLSTEHGGPNYTGSDVAITGYESNPGSFFFNGGTTGSWNSPSLPTIDPFADVPAPASIASQTPLLPTTGSHVAYNIDGCPFLLGCFEYAPGYYPTGITTPLASVAIFLPGIYYMNGSLSAGVGGSFRMAKRCANTQNRVSPANCNNNPALASLPNWQQTDGLMFYFASGTLHLSIASGVVMDVFPATDLTCDGTSPDPRGILGLPITLDGNELVGMCTHNGSYYDAGHDSRDNPGMDRGILFFQDHQNAGSPLFNIASNMYFSGAMYFHNAGFADSLTMGIASNTATWVFGRVVVDQVTLTPASSMWIALDPNPITNVKLALVQ